jgi:hypothetical protein
MKGCPAPAIVTDGPCPARPTVTTIRGSSSEFARSEDEMDTVLATRPSMRDLEIGPATIVGAPTTIKVEVLACGAADQGDDAASIIAVAALTPRLPDDVEVRAIERLDIDDLLAVPEGAGVVVIDTVAGVDPGWVIQIPFAGLVGRESGVILRSSRALAVPGTIGLASMIHRLPMVGIAVVIGGVNFGLGDALSWPVVAGLGTYRTSILQAIDHVRRDVNVRPLAAR